jgi:hypothetical protein
MAYVEIIFLRELTPSNSSSNTLPVVQLRPQMLLHMLLKISLLSEVFVSILSHKIFDPEMDSEMHD